VQDHFAMSDGGVLRLVFESDEWNSLITFQPGIPVTLGGTLELTLADGVDATKQVGRSFRIFDWTGAAPTGAFSVSSPYTWDLSKLYITGDVTLVATPAIPGDFNSDGKVDPADYLVWRNALGSIYTQEDYNVWRANFGRTLALGVAAGVATVPEPSTMLILLSFPLIAWTPRYPGRLGPR
jgi:hypothetical protein